MAVAVVAVTVGDLLMSHAMKKMGPLQLAHASAWSKGEATFAQLFQDILHLVVEIFSQPLVWLAIGFMLTFLVLWMIALSWSDLTFVMPLTALTYVLNAILVGPVLGESVTPMRWLGTLLIALGVAVVSAEAEPSKESVES
jgi:drug/metabolite transporter (DMT)-like permease